ncbi:glycosyltransferase [candidate division KSB1 bacterium]
MVTLSVIIVNYNVRDFLEQALRSVQRALREISHEIIVVDNASTDGSGRMVREKFPEVTLIENTVNMGFARANNLVLKKAEGQFIAMLNPDTLVREDTFSIILQGFEEYPDAGMIGCKVLNPDGTLQLSCRRSFPSPWVAITRLLGLSYIFPKSRLFGRYNLTYLDPDSIEEVDAISGSFMTVRKEVIETVGPLDEQYFMYGEDLDWCYEIKKFGWKILYYPRTSIVHYKGESSRQSRWNQLKLFYDAMVIFSEKHFKAHRIFTPMWILKIGIALRAVISSAGRLLRSLGVPLIDTACINGAVFLAYYIRFGGLIDLPLYGDYRDYIIIGVLSTGIMLISLFIQGVYPGHRYSLRRSFTGAVWGAMAVSLLILFSRWLAVSRLVILMSAFLQVFFLSGWRLLVTVFARTIGRNKLLPFGDELRPVRSVIIGTDEVSREIYTRFRNHPLYHQQVVGLVAAHSDNPREDAEIPVLGFMPELLEIIKKHHITDLIFPAASHSYERIIDTVTLCQSARVRFKIVPSSLELIIGKSSIVPIGEVPLLDIEYRYFEGVNRFLKRFVDIVFSGFLIITTFPGYLLVKWRKKLRSELHLTLGEQGAPLYIKQVSAHNSPYTGWARFFPLWIHILKGELSFVGPPVHTKTLSLSQRISILKPGIISLDFNRTGQTEAYDGRTFELTYLKNYSILYDLKIIFRHVFRTKTIHEKGKHPEVKDPHS